MSDQPDPNDFWGVGGIDHNPEVAARLGQFLAEFATLEACLVWMLGFIIGGSNKEDVAWALLGPVQNVTTRCQMVRDAAEKSALDVLAKGGITDFVDDIQKMNAVRNDYVHAVYETNARTHEVRRTPFAPLRRSVQASGTIITTPILSGLHHRYADMIFGNDKGLGPDDPDCPEDRWEPSIQLDQEQAIPICELDSTAHPPPQHNQLMAKRSILCRKSALRLERRGKQGREEAEQRNHCR